MNDFMELTTTKDEVDFKVLIRKSNIISVVQIVNNGSLVNLSLTDYKEYQSFFNVKENYETIVQLLK
jgi:hypothetical protein